MLPNQLKLSLVALACGLTACTTAGAQLNSSPPEELPFDTEEMVATEQPVTEPDEPAETTTSTATIGADIAGPEFDVAVDGPTLTVTGQDGVWWFDVNGKAHLVVEPAIAADYDGNGGLVFQRAADGPIVRRTAEAEESSVVSPGAGETIELIGVALIGENNQVVYLRSAVGDASLERVSLDGDNPTTIATMARDGIAPRRLTLNDGYVSGVYLEGPGAGWVTVSSTSGSKLFGTATNQLGICADRAAGCAEVVTISSDGTEVYQVMISEQSGQWDLVVNDAADFSELSRIDLQRPVDGWHPTGIELIDGLVVVSRSANDDGTGDLPALVIDPVSEEITQLDRAGKAVAITG